MGLFDAVEKSKKEEEEAKKAYARLCFHIKTALTTNSGVILRQWLKEACFMDAPMLPEYIDSVGANQRINARRDLYIALETMLQQGMNNDTDTFD